MASIANGIAEADACNRRVPYPWPIPRDPDFGASGDLTRRKLIPALFELANCGSLASRFAIVGFARSPMSDAAFQDSAADAIRSDSESCRVSEESLRAFAHPSPTSP